MIYVVDDSCLDQARFRSPVQLEMPTATVVTVLSELVCYLVLSVSDRAACETFGYIPYRLASVGESYIGLRERVQDAIVRYKQFFNGPYMIVKITFTARGIAHYSVASAGPQHGFSSMLSKQVYWPRSRTEVTEDYKAWHFHGDLPFKVGDELDDSLLLKCEFFENVDTEMT